MRPRRAIHSFACALVVAAVATPALAQAPAGAARAAHRELTIEQQNALGLLDGLSDQAKAVTDEALRIRVEARLADALWERDRERAKRLYRRAFDEIDDLNESVVDPSAAPVGARSELYVELFASLYRLDPEFANELARGLDDDPDLYDGDGLPFESLSDRSATLIGVATSVAPRNPELAVQLAHQSMANGVPLAFGGLLDALATADRSAADRLAGEAVRVALQSGSGPLDLWGIGTYLFPELQLGGGPSTSDAGAGADVKRQYLEAAYAVTGRFVTGLAEHSLDRESPESADPSSVYSGQGLVMSYALARKLAPLFDAYDPERSVAYRVLVGQIEGVGPADIRDRVATTSSSVDSPDALMAQAGETADSGLRTSLYARAAFAAMRRDGYEAAKGCVAKIDDPVARSRVLGPLAREAVSRAISDSRFDDARRYVADIPAVDERGAAYCDIARALVAAGRRMIALDVLDDAERLLAKDASATAESKARAFVRLANLTAALDGMHGFDVMGGAVAAVNKALVSFDTANTRGRNPNTMFQLAAFDPSTGLEELAHTDYFRALALAQSLGSRPLAILAQLAVVRGTMSQTLVARPPAAPAAERGAKPRQRKPGAAPAPKGAQAPAAAPAPAP